MDTFRHWIDLDRRWRETVIWGSPEAIAHLIAQIDASLPPDWERNPRGAEARYKERGGTYPSAICYARRLLPAGEVWLWLNQPSPGRLVGGNVIPDNQFQGNYARHAGETSDIFRREILEPAAKTAGVRVDVNKIGPLSQVSADTMEQLWQVADESDRTLPLPPSTMAKWRKAVIAARSTTATFDPDELSHWFATKGWSDSDARRLADKFFEDARLLSAYDEARKPA